MAWPAAEFEVRTASERDVARLVELDLLAFGGLGMGHYGESHVRCWLEVNPAGLLVAWRGASAVAYCYCQYINFSLADVPRLTTDSAFTDSAYTRKTHRPDGNSIHVVSVSSIVPGGRRALFDTLIRDFQAQSRKLLILFSRMPGFGAYCQRLTEECIDVASLGRARLARWYALECADRGGARVWAQAQREALALPPPSAPDPVLNKYLKDPGAALVATCVDWVEDPASCHCSALVAIGHEHGPPLWA